MSTKNALHDADVVLDAGVVAAIAVFDTRDAMWRSILNKPSGTADEILASIAMAYQHRLEALHEIIKRAEMCGFAAGLAKRKAK